MSPPITAYFVMACRQIADMISTASTALAWRDTRSAQTVIDGFEDPSTEGLVTRIVYAQGKTATNSSVGNAVIQSLADLAGMGSVARTIARAALAPGPLDVLPESVSECFTQLGDGSADLAASFQDILSTGSIDAYRRADDHLGLARRRLYSTVGGVQWAHGVPMALHVMRFDSYFDDYSTRAALVAQRMRLVFVDSEAMSWKD